MRPSLSKFFNLVVFQLALLLSISFISAHATEDREEDAKDVKDDKLFKQAKTKIGSKILKKFTELTVSTSLDLLDLNIVDGLNLAIDEKYKVEPSFFNGFFSRLDRYEVNVNVKPGDLIGENISPIYLNIKAGGNIYVVRQFKSQEDALISAPFEPWKLPINAQSALEHMKPGDFAAFPTNLTLSLGARYTQELTGSIGAEAGVFYFVNGKFEVQVVRLSNNRVRLRLLAVKSKGTGINAEVEADLDIFKVRLLDKLVDKVIGDELLEFVGRNGHGKLLLVDYEIDLSTEKGQSAYNKILSPKVRIKTMKSVSPLISLNKTMDNLISDLGPLSAIEQEENLLPLKEKTVQRKFLGLNEYIYHQSDFSLGTRLLRYKSNRSSVDNDVKLINNHDEVEKYNYLEKNKGSKFKFLWGFGREEKNEKVFTLVDQTTQGQIELNEIGLNREFKDANLRRSEQLDIKKYVEKNVPASISKIIPWGEFLTRKSQKNARVKIDLILNIKNTLTKIITKNNLLKIYQAFVKENVKYFHMKEIKLNAGNIISNRAFHYKANRDRFLKLVGEMLSDDTPVLEKAKLFIKIQNSSIYSQLGLKFFKQLMNEDNFMDATYFQLSWTSSSKKITRFEYGKNDRSEFYKNLEFISSAIGSRPFDLRIVGYDPEGVEAK